MIANTDIDEQLTTHPDSALLAEYASGQLNNSLGKEFFDHLMDCGRCQIDLSQLVHSTRSIRQLRARREQRGFIRESRTLISGISEKGSIVVPRGQAVCFPEELKAWRRVAVTWRSERIVLSRAAWDACVPCGA